MAGSLLLPAIIGYGRQSIVDEAGGGSTLAQYIGASAVGPPTMTAIHEATADDQNALDLAYLVCSAARPGLKQRIETYRARQLASLPAPTLSRP